MTYTNKFDERTEATKRAQAILKAKGVYYPLPDRELSPEENYERILKYSEQEAALVVELLKATTITKPTELNDKPKREWRDWNDN